MWRLQGDSGHLVLTMSVASINFHFFDRTEIPQTLSGASSTPNPQRKVMTNLDNEDGEEKDDFVDVDDDNDDDDDDNDNDDEDCDVNN